MWRVSRRLATPLVALVFVAACGGSVFAGIGEVDFDAAVESCQEGVAFDPVE